MDELLSLFDDGETPAEPQQQQHTQKRKTPPKPTAATVEKSSKPELTTTKIRKQDGSTCSHSGIRITKRIVNSDNLNDIIEPFTYKTPVAIAAMPKNELESYDQELCTIGIITKKCGTRMTKTGASFCIFELGSFLNNSTSTTGRGSGIGTILTVFLFGEAYSKFVSKSNLQEGSVVVLVAPTILPPKPGGKTNVSLSIRDGDRLVHIGTAQDYGTCQGKTFKGLRCKEAIDLRRASGGCYCSLHAKQALASKSSAIRKQPARVPSSTKRNSLQSTASSSSLVQRMKMSHSSNANGAFGSNSAAANHWLAKQMQMGNDGTARTTTPANINPYAKKQEHVSNAVKRSSVSTTTTTADNGVLDDGLDDLFANIEFPAAPPGYRSNNTTMLLKNAPKHMNASSRQGHKFASSCSRSSSGGKSNENSCRSGVRQDDLLGNMLGTTGGRNKRTLDQSRRNNKRVGPGSLSMYTKSTKQPSAVRGGNVGGDGSNNKKARVSLSTICGDLDGQVYVPQPSRVLFGGSKTSSSANTDGANGTSSNFNTPALSQVRAEAVMEKQRALKEALQKRKEGGASFGSAIRSMSSQKSSSSPRSIADKLFDGMDVANVNETLSATSKFASEAEAEQYAKSRLIVTELETKEMLADKRKSKKKEAKLTGLKTEWFCATCNCRTSFQPRDCVRARHPVRRERSIIRAPPAKDSAAAKKTKIAADKSLTLGSGLEWSGWRGV